MIRKKSTRAAEIAFADEVMASDEFAALPERVRSTVRNQNASCAGIGWCSNRSTGCTWRMSNSVSWVRN